MTKLKMIEGEQWWGGVVERAYEMPYNMASNCTIDLMNSGNDQRSALYISNKGRFIWSKDAFSISFDKGIITIEGSAEIELGEGFGNLKGAHQAVASKFFMDCKQIPDQRFFEVPQYNTWIELMYNQNQKQILEYAHAIVENGMSPGILMIDEGWSEDYGVFDFYPGRFTDPKAMVEELHELGFVVMLWITPQISPDSNAFRELRDTEFLIRDKNGEFAIRKWWNGFSCVLDLSNPKAQMWLHGKLQEVMKKYQVDGFKFDAGDAYFYENDDRTYVPQTKVANTKDYNIFACGYRFNELRAVWNMGGSPLVCRLQDKLHSWDERGIQSVIPCTLVQGLIGYYYGCPDMIGGGDFGSFLVDDFRLDEELYLRWLEASVLCPMMQFSIAPWRVLSEENYQTVKEYAILREKFSPYIIELAKNAAMNYEPIVRPLDYVFPNEGYETTTDMFMLGDRYLVVPMLEKGGVVRKIKFPSGTWKETDGSIYQGGEEVELIYSLRKLYIFEQC